MSKKESGREIDEDLGKIESESTTNTPRWVKMFGIIAIVLVLLVVLIMIISGGEHGPGRHIKSDDAVGQTLLLKEGIQQL